MRPYGKKTRYVPLAIWRMIIVMALIDLLVVVSPNLSDAANCRFTTGLVAQLSLVIGPLIGGALRSTRLRDGVSRHLSLIYSWV